ncbi:hypothetical protein ACJIZ3_014375 [Penstemon smallii]|uniref:TF-B3 domain-containing protein n=1 Tax=Penstemon smallii TaxID=265156 RepID=A0ABD3RJD5_9LAMI
MKELNIPQEANKSMPRLYIDSEIWKPHSLSNYNVAWLRIPAVHGTRYWEVKLQRYKSKGLSMQKPRLALGKGWSAFCVDNNLREGDELDMKFMELKREGMGADILHIFIDVNVVN